MTLKIGKEQTIIDYLTGVEQGDVLAPILFLFPMQAMAECVLVIWKEKRIEPIYVSLRSQWPNREDDETHTSKIKTQNSPLASGINNSSRTLTVR